MNLEQIYRQLSSVQQDLNIKYREYSNKEQPYYYSFDNIFLLVRAYQTVREYAPFLISAAINDYLQPALKVQYFLTTNKSDGDNLITGANLLEGAVNRYLTYLRPIISDDSDPNTLFVKFTHIGDLNELEKTIGQLKLALNVPIYELDGHIELKQIDSGSIIFELVIVASGVTAILKMVADLVRTAINNKTLYHQSEMAAEQLRTIQLKNDTLEIIKKQVEDNYEQNKEDGAQRIINAYNITSSPDTINNFKGSIEAFNSLIEKGAEFYPSLKATEEVKKSFPTPKELELLSEAKKLLDKAKDSGDDEKEATD